MTIYVFEQLCTFYQTSAASDFFVVRFYLLHCVESFYKVLQKKNRRETQCSNCVRTTLFRV